VKRQDKAELVEQMNQSLSGIPHVILTSFRGLNVNQATDLRSRIRRAGGRVRVIKNRLAKRAASGTPAEPLVEHFEGPCALATHESDPVSLAKALADFTKDNPQLELLAGIVDAKDLLDKKGVKQLAALPGLPELRAQLLSLLQTPASQLVRLLSAPGSQLARALDAHREKQEQTENS
jgi:large subunit ribosomal protein L10